MTHRHTRDTERNRRSGLPTGMNDVPVDPTGRPNHMIDHQLLKKFVSADSYGFILLLIVVTYLAGVSVALVVPSIALPSA